MGKTSRFNDKEDTLIINYMYYMEKKCNYKCDYYKFVKISESMPKYTPKQISNHWKNHLYPNYSIVKRIKQRLKSKILIENYYNYENNAYFEKNHLNKRRPEDIVRNSSQKVNSSYSKKDAPQNYHIKQEHQKFKLPLPSSDNVPSYSQNDSSSRIPIESLLNDNNCFPRMNEVAKEYYSTI